MPTKLEEIHELEVNECYPEVIEALEERVSADFEDWESVIRLGFNLWYAIVENDRLQLNLPVEKYAPRFMDLLHEYTPKMSDNADFCWAYGLGLDLFPHLFPDATPELGKELMKRAREIDSFYAAFGDQPSIQKRFGGRGI